MNENQDLVTPEDKLKLLFPDRPWESEPDDAEWDDAQTGYKCVIVRNHITGTLCGYVGVPRGHSLYGMTYQDAEKNYPFHVHGGLTYSGKRKELFDDYHYFGFDTSHVGDLSPMLAVRMLRWAKTDGVVSHHKDETYRTFDYVKREVEVLAWQLSKFDIGVHHVS